MVRAAIRASRRRGRFGPLPIELSAGANPCPVTLSGSYLPEMGDHIFLTIAARRQSADRADADGGLPDAEAFTLLATEALKIDANRPIAMSLLSIDGLVQLLDKLEPQNAADLEADIEAELRANALDGSAAGGLSADRYGIVHDSDVDIPHLKKTIATRARDAHPAGKTLPVRSSTVSLAAGDLSEADCAKALLYTINAFAEGKGDFSVTDLLQGYRRMRSETIRRVRSHRKVIASGAFDALFQPIGDLHDRSVHHHEALLRLRENGGRLHPSNSSSLPRMWVSSVISTSRCAARSSARSRVPRPSATSFALRRRDRPAAAEGAAVPAEADRLRTRHQAAAVPAPDNPRRGPPAGDAHRRARHPRGKAVERVRRPLPLSRIQDPGRRPDALRRPRPQRLARHHARLLHRRLEACPA